MDLRLPPQTPQTGTLPTAQTLPVTITLPAGTTLPQSTTLLTLKILQSSGTTATAELPNGQQITLTTSTPLPTGSLLKLPPQPNTPTPAGTSLPSTPLTLQANLQLTRQLIQSSPLPGTPTNTPSQPQIQPQTTSSSTPTIPLQIPSSLNLSTLGTSQPTPLPSSYPVTLKTSVTIPPSGATLTATAPQTVPAAGPQNPYPAPTQPAVVTSPQTPLQPVQLENQPALPVGTPLPITPTQPTASSSTPTTQPTLQPAQPPSNPINPQSPNPVIPQSRNPITPTTSQPHTLTPSYPHTLSPTQNITIQLPTPPNTAQPSTPQPSNPTSPAPAPIATASAPNFTPPAPEISPSAPQPHLSRTSIFRTVLESTPSPQPGQTTLVLGTPNAKETQTLSITSPVPFPPGTTVEISLNETQTSATLLSVTFPKEQLTNQTVSSFATQWPNLQKALNQLPAETAQKIRDKLPNIQALSTTLAPFIEAVRTGKTKHLTDDETISVLKSLGIDFSQDIQKLQTLHTPETSENWRGVLFPYIENATDNPRQGGFFWRNQKEEKECKSSTNTRFIVQLNLSQMGPLQLDGLLKYPNLWLKLRTSEPTSENLTTGLQTMVQNLLQSIGLEGGISIETTSKFPTDPLAEITTPTTYTTTL